MNNYDPAPFEGPHLTANEIGQIDNRQKLFALFGELGYQADNPVGVNLAQLGLDNADLRQQIQGIWLVGDDPVGGDITIYLFEVRSVTVALRQQIARRFREISGDYLLVLTSDYETLDFVLLERIVVPQKTRSATLKQTIRPRALTVDRRNPTTVQLRTLNRFAVTEAESLYQWDKLLAAYDVAVWSEPYFNNRALFSDYYLNHRLPDAPAWGDDVRPIGRQVMQLMADARTQFAGKSESVIRQRLYEPLFSQLGFRVESATDSGSADVADYRLYNPAAPETPIAEALTYVWERNLDSDDPQREGTSSVRQDEIPGARVVSLLERGETPWVIVTNGRMWRLYSATASNKATNYYEIDLLEAVTTQQDTVHALNYWWLFFRREAFGGFLDDLLRDSHAYATELGERLKDDIFTRVFPPFARGFIESLRSQGMPTAGIDLDEVFQGTLTFLYRLMFVLYAESLELLPLQEARGYGQHALARLKGEIAEAAGTVEDNVAQRLQRRYSNDAYELYDRLTTLFSAIDVGNEAWNLPTYNGGLFSQQNTSGQWLGNVRLDDYSLAVGLDRLCRDVDDKTQALVFIDYKSLGVRQLGSIYEGLLEFKLRIAEEPLSVVRESGKELYVPAAEAGNRRVYASLAVSDVYVENVKRERRATGSYYTPDYIVKYIVRETVGPVLDRKFDALTPQLATAQRNYRSHVKRVEQRGNDQPPALFWQRPEMQELANACLDVKVLDPAVGSGHFLVEAVDYISNRLITFLNGWSDNPVWAQLDLIRTQILESLDSQKVSVDVEQLTQVALLKRAVLKRCVYGVDVNPMAVELAKVSLWLDAFTLGAPLSFLDHHVKCGNSLIGTRIKEVEEAVEGTADRAVQLGLFSGGTFTGLSMATDLMRQVSYLSDNTVAQVDESQRAYRDALAHLAYYKRILDMYTSRWFGNAPTKSKDVAVEFIRNADTREWLREATGPLPVAQRFDAEEVAEAALAAATEKRFFHWELEFPEVFFAPSTPGGQDVQLREENGFDATIGNPPYANAIESTTSQGADELSFAGDNFSAAKGAYDLYIPFMEIGATRTKRFGYSGMIVQNKWLATDYGRGIRKLLFDRTNIVLLADFSSYNVFVDAAAYPIVFVIQTGAERSDLRVENFSQYLSKPTIHSVDANLLENWIDTSWGVVLLPFELLSRTDSTEFSTLNEHYIVAASATAGEAYQILPEVVEENEATSRGFFKLVTSGIIDRYDCQWGRTTTTYLKKRFDRPVISRNAVSDTRKMQYSSRKIIVANMTKQLEAIADNGEIAGAVATLQIFIEDEQEQLYILALMNSSLMNHIHRVLFGVQSLAGGYISFTRDQLGALIVPNSLQHIDDNPEPSDATTTNELIQFSQSDSQSVLDKVAQLYANNRILPIRALLAHLAESMISYQETKSAKASSFLLGLENTLLIGKHGDKSGIDSLTGKSIIANYAGDYKRGESELPWAEFYYRLHQNRRKFGVKLETVKGEIEAAYETSLAALRPIKEQLAATDALIDRIVYQLYGLTDEEIALIEQPAYEQALRNAKAKVLADEKLQQDTDAALDAMAEEILPAAEHLQRRVNISAEDARLDADLPGWRLFAGKVPTFLRTGEYNIATQPADMDFSTSIVQYAKAVEQAIIQRLFQPFRDAGYKQSDCRNSFLKKYVAGEKHLTLGSFEYILTSKEQALAAFAERQYPGRGHNVFFDKTGGVRALLSDSTSVVLRNKAAHSEVLTREDAQAARAWALAILRYL